MLQLPATPQKTEMQVPTSERQDAISCSSDAEGENAAIAPSDIAATSQENLIPQEQGSPSPLRPARKVEEVKTPVKRRQPKTGWL